VRWSTATAAPNFLVSPWSWIVAVSQPAAEQLDAVAHDPGAFRGSPRGEGVALTPT
jgi:hypothetical protein